MSQTPLIQSVREEIRALIAEAVTETDAVRRLALLATADHWIGVARPTVRGSGDLPHERCAAGS